MTEQTTKLGQGHDLISWGYSTQVDLLAGEVPLLAWDVAFQSHWWAGPWGTLYLTDQRLVWIRWRSSLPLTKKLAIIPLNQVRTVETGRDISRYFFLRLLVVRLEGGQRLRFLPIRGKANVEEMAGEITSILRERGLLRD